MAAVVMAYDADSSTQPDAPSHARGRPDLREDDRAQAVRARACAGLAVLALLGGIALALSHAAPRRSGSNGVVTAEQIAEAPSGSTFCQRGEVLPADTASLRILAARSDVVAPRLLVTLRRDGRVLRRSSVPPGWADGRLVVPIGRTTRDYGDVEVCVKVGRGGGVAFEGDDTPPAGTSSVLDGDATGRSVRIDYYRPGRETWWSYAPAIARRIGFGRGGWGGGWVAGLVAGLLLAAIALAGRVVWRTIAADEDERGKAPATAHARLARARAALRRVPATAWTLALIGFLNAAAWSLITPVYLVPDEMWHIAYVQEIGETGRPPVPRGGPVLSQEMDLAMARTLSGTISMGIWRATMFTALDERRLARALSAPLGRRGNGDADGVDPEPPLYYALEAIPYRVARGGTLLERIALMRLLSAGMAGVTVLFAFLFVRECLPGRRWAWSVGGLSAAFLPMLGFISGGVNPDALLFAVSAALFFCLARAFRRGLTRRLAIWTGVVLGVGMVAKINFYGLVPAAVLAVVLAARRTEGAWSARALARSALAVGVGAAPYALVTGLEALVWERSLVLVHSTEAAHADHGGLVGQLSFLWQVYLPPLPGQAPAFPSYIGYRLWFESFVGNFGWLNVRFPDWAYRVALASLTLVGALALRAVAVDRAAVRRRAAELVGYVLMAGSLLGLIAMVALRGWAPGIDAAAQGRYLLPLLALFAALVALAARGVGAAWGRAAGAVLVVAFVGWSVFGALVAIAGFYG